MQSFRRIITANDQSGKSYLASDQTVPPVGLGDVNFCHTVPDRDGIDMRFDPAIIPFAPNADESIFRIFTIPPENPRVALVEMDRIAWNFFSVAGEAARVDTTRHPLMHTTSTIDYIMLLSGDASLLLDTGDPVVLNPFDVVVQQSTNHAWIATGAGPAVFAAVLLGCQPLEARRA